MSLDRKHALVLMSVFLIIASHTLAQAPEQHRSPQAATAAHQTTFGTEIKKTVGLLRVTYIQAGAMREQFGTCLFVAYPDERIGKDQGFWYLVTNRHVAVPGG